MNKLPFFIAAKTVVFFGILLFANTQNSYAQKRILTYLSTEVDLGNYIGVSMNLNYTLKGSYSFKVGVVGNIRSARNEPADYALGLITIATFGLGRPMETVGSVNVAAGKIYYLNQAESIRLNAAVGIGFTEIQTIENWQKNPNSFLGENYTYDKVKKNTVSLIINPKVELTLGKVFGFSVSPMAVLNSKSNYYGVGLGYIIGRVK